MNYPGQLNKQLNGKIHEPLSRAEKIQRIRAAIKEKKLPPWADPSYGKRPPQNLLDQFENRDCITKFHERVQKVSDFRKWYDAVYSPKYATRREQAREKTAAEQAWHQHQLSFLDRQTALQKVLQTDYVQEEQEGVQAQSIQPSVLEEMKTKADTLRKLHQTQDREYVDRQYERIWRNGMGADQIRNLDHILHKRQATKDLGEQMLFRMLDEMEDSQIDEYYRNIAEQSAAKERCQLDEEAEEKRRLEQRAMELIKEQIREKEKKKEQNRLQELQEESSRLLKEEKVRFENFKEDFGRAEQQAQNKRSPDEGGVNTVMEKERAQTVVRERQEAEEWAEYLEKEKADKLAAETLAKNRLRQEHFARDKYNQQLLAASGTDAVEKHIAQFQKEQQYEALYTFLSNLKARQGLQYRINKELENQVTAKGLQKEEIKRDQEKEREQEAIENGLFMKRKTEIEVSRRQRALENATILQEQIQQRKAQDEALSKNTTEFYKAQQEKREEEDAYIKSLAAKMLSAV